MSGTATDVAFLTRALKMPRTQAVAASFAESARQEGWDYLEFLSRILAEEVASRETHGGQHRVAAAGPVKWFVWGGWFIGWVRGGWRTVEFPRFPGRVDVPRVWWSRGV